MIELLVRLLRPLIIPLLKLKTEVPHLPEGTSLVRHLRPTEQWLTYQYLAVLFGMFMQFAGVVAASVVLLTQGHLWQVLTALGLLSIELAVLCVSLVSVRVDYELRHYLVGDRSLRVSSGSIIRKEVTLSYANVQNLEIQQGPIERLFGYKSITVSTAGSSQGTTEGANLHQVTLAGLEDADAVRELILGMLKQHRDSGLGETTPEPGKPEDTMLSRLLEVRDAAKVLKAAAEKKAFSVTTT